MRRIDGVPSVLLVLAAVLIAFLALPVGVLLVLTPAATVLDTLRDREVQGALATSGVAALLASLFGLVFGVPLAYLLARREFRGKRLVEGLVDLPVVLPHTAAGVALLFVIGRQGVVGSRLQDTPFELTGTIVGVAVAMAFVSTPFLVRTAREAFRGVDPVLEATARTLGASPMQAFRRVTLPLASRGIGAGFVLMWARGVSEFGSVVIVAYRPFTAPVLLWDRFEKYGLVGAQPLGALLVVLALALFVAAQVIAGRLPARGESRV